MSGKPLVPYDEARAPRKPKPRVGVRKVNPKTGGNRFPERRQPEYTKWFDEQKFPCLLASLEWGGYRVGHGDALGACSGIIEKAHVKSRGAGGEDVDNIVPLCTWHHARLHRVGQRQFEFELGKKLKPIAQRIGAKYSAWKKHGS